MKKITINPEDTIIEMEEQSKREIKSIYKYLFKKNIEYKSTLVGIHIPVQLKRLVKIYSALNDITESQVYEELLYEGVKQYFKKEMETK